jgi:NADPH:quinone reductase-like Zn-dependent oxidoreductase
MREGALRSPIHATFGLTDLPAAFEMLASRRVLGKIIVHPDS